MSDSYTIHPSNVPYPTKGSPPNEQDISYKENEYRKTFSKTILEHKIEEYHTGKLTKKYIEVYLDFVHLEGIIDNLQYIEYKEKLNRE